MNFSKTKVLAAAVAVMFTAAAVDASAALSRKPQDNLIYASANDPLGLDPALVDDNESGKINCNIYESLLRFEDDSTNVVPELAESYTVSEDGLTYTFKLRQGVTFHDGTPFNAEAVKFNIVRQLPENATAKMSYASMVYGDVADVQVIDDYTVAIVLKTPSTPFLHNIAMMYAAPIASPTALQNSDNNISEHPVGTGPYKFVAWDKGQQVILTRYENYWGEPGATANLIFRTMPETSARVVALNNGEIDATDGIDANVIPEIEQAGNIVQSKVGMSTQYMFFNCDPKKTSVTKDRAVRKAIAQAINIPEMVQSLYKGYDTPATTFLPDTLPGYSPDVKPVSYDPEAAKKAFADLGVDHLTIMTYSGARIYNTVGGQVLAEAIQGYLNQAGVKVDVVVYDWATYKNKLITDEFDIGFIGWNGDNGDPDNFLSLLATDDPINNPGLWSNQEYRDLISQGVKLPDGQERNDTYAKAEMVIAEDVGILPLSHPTILAAVSPKVTNFSIHPIGLTFMRHVGKQP